MSNPLVRDIVDDLVVDLIEYSPEYIGSLHHWHRRDSFIHFISFIPFQNPKIENYYLSIYLPWYLLSNT